MAKRNIEKAIEDTLKSRKIKYNKIKENGFNQFVVHNIGEEMNIVQVDDFVSVKVSLLEEDDIKKLANILYRLGWTYKNVTYSKKRIERMTLFTIDIYPYADDTFVSAIDDLNTYFRSINLSRYPVQSIEQSPKEFFLNEYKSFVQIPEAERISALESILQIKERYFRNVRSLKAIKDRLFELKEFAIENSNDVDLEEFFLLDFAALFRVLELGLLKLSLKDFFDNFKGEIRK
ncbi:hypothetical protein [Caldisericum exile]|uniref:Uncharacterized protein n=1 Tax=Caldisericum exile (strain DSM 21853 / NBRC 104410 / AZM16c01) TaxID=511051 RepID=A0A7U6GFN9_CALEA|nr:hypothetical protein [Caldisericum exile]BAL81462.1 hypothetical protein CSE_13360 [Caldisericum exile AZM16c01]